MSNIDKFYLFFSMMEKHNFMFSQDVVRDLNKLVKNDIDVFIHQLAKDFLIMNYDDYNRFERLNLKSTQKQLLRGGNLYRYEYRKKSNLRVLFATRIKSKTIFLCAFNENQGKRHSKDAYNKNIERAIDILNRIWRDNYE